MTFCDWESSSFDERKQGSAAPACVLFSDRLERKIMLPQPPASCFDAVIPTTSVKSHSAPQTASPIQRHLPLGHVLGLRLLLGMIWGRPVNFKLIFNSNNESYKQSCNRSHGNSLLHAMFWNIHTVVHTVAWESQCTCSSRAGVSFWVYEWSQELSSVLIAVDLHWLLVKSVKRSRLYFSKNHFKNQPQPHTETSKKVAGHIHAGENPLVHCLMFKSVPPKWCIRQPAESIGHTPK